MGIFDKLIGQRKKTEDKASIYSPDNQKKMTQSKPKQEVAYLFADRNKWAFVSLGLLLCLIITTLGWYVANERFANHVKVAFVKLEPSGNYTVSIYDENSGPTYFANTVYSLLTNYAERRYSKISHSIDADYGFVLNFMSPRLKNEFLTDYHAAKVAAEFSHCMNCKQIGVQVRTVQNEETDEAIVNGKPGTIYKSNVFAVATEYNPDGSVSSKANEIIALTWRIKPVSELPTTRDEVRANPIGIEILSDTIKADPTPVS